jgi:DNA primase
MIPPSFIQELLARVDIVDVVGRAVQLKKAGANFLGLCPFHGEKSPSFTVSPTKQFYHCFGCGAHGTAISFMIEHSGLGFIDAVKELAQATGMKVPELDRAEAAALQRSNDVDLFELMASIAQFYKQRLRESNRAIDYLKNRGLSGEIAARYAIGYAPAPWRGLEAAVADYQHESLVVTGMVIDSGQAVDVGQTVDAEQTVNLAELPSTSNNADSSNSSDHFSVPRKRRFDRFRDRIMFPIRNPRGQVIGFGGRVLDRSEPKYMNSPETPLFSKGRELYGLFEARQALRQTDCAIVVEGYMDVVMLAQYGVTNAVATLGTATTPEHVQKLLRLVDRVVFAFDGDAAGRKAAWRALEACLPKASDTKRIDFLFLPSEHDPDSYVREFGKSGFDEIMANALPLSEFLVSELARRSSIETAEGRAQFLAAARPLVLAMPPVALRLQLVHRLAEWARIATSELNQYLQQGVRQTSQGALPGRAAPSAGTLQRSARVPMRAALRPTNLFTKVRVLTALHPSLAKIEIDPSFLNDEVRVWLERIGRLPAGSSFAGLTESLRMESTELADRIADEVSSAAALSECGIDEARQEFVGAVLKLREEGLELEKKALAERGLASPQDRARFQYLLTIRLVD